MNKSLILIPMLAASLSVQSQTEDEYLMEVGAGVGTMSYVGDFNGSIFKNMQPMASLVLKRLWGPYIGVQANVSYGKAKGDSKNVTTFYPDENQQRLDYSFSNPVIDAGLRFEYNFWPYGTGREYRGAQPLTPFIFLGIGGTYVDCGEGSEFALNVPIGLGVKYKVAPRLNLGLEWAMHFTGADKIDGRRDPNVVKSTGAFKNKDGYSCLQFTVTYSFKAKCVICHNADE